MEDLNSIGADLLRFCAFLAPDAIPEQLIIDGTPELGPRLRPLVDNLSLLDEAIGILLRFSLVQRNRDESTLSVHRLVQAVLRNGMDRKTQRTWAKRTVLTIKRTLPDVTDYRNWPRCQQYLPHAQACAALIADWKFTFSEAGELLNQVGYYLKERAQYMEAEPLFKQAAAIDEKALGTEHPNLARDLNNLALLYRDQGKYAEAELLFKRALAISEKALGLEHPTLATRLNNLAMLYADWGRYAEAEPLFKKAIAIGEQTLGSRHPKLAIRLNNLALLYWNQGKYAEAEPLFKQAIAIDEKALGPVHPNLARDLNNLATSYREQGKYAEAEPLFERAIATIEKTLGLEHPTTIKIRENFAEFLKKAGQ